MEKERIIAKLNIRDYNKELEKILQEKKYSKLCSNLLLSLFYKIENSYEDYKKIKIEVPTKKEYIEELLNIISKSCNEIKIVKLNSDEALELKDKQYKINKNKKEIITYQNELFLLNALYEIENKFEFDSIDRIRKNAISKILNNGEIALKCEAIRDFDGWSWNANLNEIEDFTSNVLYQMMVYLLGYENLAGEEKLNMKLLENKLNTLYKQTLVEKILKSFSQIAIIQYLKTNKNDIDEIKNIIIKLKEKQEEMANKQKYIEDITKEKKKCIKEIEKIDKYINNDLEMKREYIKQNEILPQDKRVFSLSDFSDKVQEDRERLNDRIKVLTENLKPKNFLKEQARIEKNLEYLEELDLKNLNENILMEEFLKTCLKAFNEQIDKVKAKKEILEKIYELRYIKLFYINKNKTIGSICKKEFINIEKKLITKACNLKAITIFSKNITENYQVYKNIFKTKIIDLNNTYIIINENNFVQIYDENSLEKEEKIQNLKELLIKYNKKIKIFI